MKTTQTTTTTTTMEQEPLEYPLASILYCVKCNWVLRASWYQQELLQTFTQKAKTTEEAIIRSVIMKPSYVSGTFKVFTKQSVDAEWVQVWDRVEDNGFPEAKILKQRIRNVLSPETTLGHSDKSSVVGGTLVSDAVPISRPRERTNSANTGSSLNASVSAIPKSVSEADTIAYGSPRLAAAHKTFCEECLDTLPPPWEM